MALSEKEKGYCRKYREANKELLARKIKEYRIKNKDKIREQKRIYCKNNREKINESSREYKRAWCKRNPEKIRAYGKSHRPTKERKKEFNRRAKDNLYFSGMRKAVLARDGNRCQLCGITGEEHKRIWRRELQIHHIDGNGRSSAAPNNTLSNLTTYCIRCHKIIENPGSQARKRKI